MIRIAIVEDDFKQAEFFENALRRYEREFANEEFEISRYNNGVDFIDGYKAKFDVVFMDIEMPLMNGMETAKKLRELDETVVLVFVTNMAQFAVKGYEVAAFDFVVKPFTYEMLCQKMQRIIKCLSKTQEKKVSLQTDAGVKVVTVSSIYYVEVMGHKLLWHTKEGNYTFCGSLKGVEQDLKQYGFARCHNCFLVNLQYVSDVKTKTLVCGGDELEISRPRKSEFLTEFAAYLEALL